MRKPVDAASKVKVDSASGKSNNRRRIASRLIAERLGIAIDWDDAAATPATPGDLPDYGEPKLSLAEASEIKASITKLINLDCNGYVVYRCIEQLITVA